MTTELQKYEDGLGVEKFQRIAGGFNEVTVGLKELVEESKAVTVKDVSDVDGMKQAREVRLKLRKIRADVERKRKELKETALLESQAIDSMSKVVQLQCKQVEDRLQEMEDTAKRAEQERIAKLVQERTIALHELNVDCTHFDLGAMTDEAFDALYDQSRMAFEAKKREQEAEAKRIEEERIAKEKADAEKAEAERLERERIAAENERLRKEKEEAERKAEEERKEREAEVARIEAERQKERDAAEAKLKAEREAAEKLQREKEEAERKAQEEAALRAREKEEAEKREQDRIAAEKRAAEEAELARIKAEKEAEQARLAAPDKEKLQDLDRAICSLQIPPVSSDVALRAVKDIRSALNGTVKVIRSAISALEEEANQNG